MTAIVSSGGTTAAPSTPTATTSTGAFAGTSAQGTGTVAEVSDVFTQLIANMLNVTSSPAKPGALPLPQDLSSLDLANLDVSGDPLELSIDDGDSDLDIDDLDDEDASALSLAAMLSGFPALALSSAPQVASSSSSTAPGTAEGGAGTAGIEGDLLASRTEIDITQSAINALTGGAADAANDALSVDTDPTAITGTQNNTSTPQIHTLMPAHGGPHIDAPPDATLRAPVGSPAWKDELGTQLTWMAVNGREAASLRLSPEHLGPLDIRISMKEGEASVYFGASNPDTRSALEQSLPRLRELFAASGLVLGDAGVSRDAPRNSFKPSTQPGTTRSVSDASSESPVKSVTLSRVGLIDTYV